MVAELNISTETREKVLSFHPLVRGHFNIWAFSAVDERLFTCLTQVKGVIFPQVFPEVLYRLALARGLKTFPEYRVRFDFPGKHGQVLLFRLLDLPHPKTLFVPKLAAFGAHPGVLPLTLPKFPFVVKTLDEHEGYGVFLVTGKETWETVSSYLKAREREGRFGFLMQEYLPGHYDARVVLIGRERLVFWREKKGFKGNLAQEGCLVPCPDKGLEEKALALAETLAQKTGINLAAVDFLVSDKGLFLNEINYVFGRRALKGKFEALFFKAVKEFLRVISP